MLNADGVAKVRVDRLKAGKHKLSLVYLGSESAAATT